MALVPIAVAMLAHPDPVRAAVLGLQAQTEFDFTQVKFRGQKATGRGRFSTNYNLVVRRPFLPTSTLLTDLTINSTDTGDTNTTQRTNGWLLNLYSNEPTWMFNSRLAYSNYGTSSDYAESSSGYTRDYTVGLFLRQPAYPVLNLQFQRDSAGTSYAGTEGSYTTTSYLLGSSYDLAPLRFSYDRVRQSFGYSGSPGISTNNQTASVTLNHTLLPGLTLAGELTRLNNDVNYESMDTSSKTTRRLLRLSVTPLRSTVADFTLSSNKNDQSVGIVSGTSNDRSTSWDVRSEILPGLSLNYQDVKQSLSGSAYLGTRGNTSRNQDLSLAARLAEGTVFSITKDHSTYDVASTVYHAKEDTLQSTLQTSLTGTTDLSLDYGQSKSTTGGGDLYRNTYQGISLRDRTSSRLSLGATYRMNHVRSTVFAGDSFSQDGGSTDLDMLWQPNYDVGINLRLSYQKNHGTGAFRSFAPSGNIRWQVDPSTNVTASYSLQHFRQFDPTFDLLSGQNTRGLSFRMTHSFSSRSSLDLVYDFQASNIADLEWHKQLSVVFTVNP